MATDQGTECVQFPSDIIANYSTGDLDYRESLRQRGEALFVRLLMTDASASLTDSLLPVVVGLRSRSEEGGEFRLHVIRSGRGRPQIDLSEEQLQYFLDHGFSVTDIGVMLGISRSTIHRRIRSFGLAGAREFSDTDDQQLDDVVRNIQSVFPKCGEKSLESHLSARGLRVQRRRIRDSLHRTDEVGVAIRRRLAILRRRYHVIRPNALWHIDGNHKLIRYHVTPRN